MRCALHPDTETNLRCGKCDQLICPRCLVQTPVGARCPKCAAVKRLPVYTVPAIYYLRAIAAGFVSAAVLGAVWGLLPLHMLAIFISMGIGYGVGEIISISVNRKYGIGLQVIAAVSMCIAYVIRALIDTRLTDFTDSLLDVWGMVGIFLGIVVAVSRLRRN